MSEGRMSFSIDALLAKEGPRRREGPAARTPDTPDRPPLSPHSGTSSPGDSRHSSPLSSPSPGSPGRGLGGVSGSSIIPRPGLLNIHHPALGATPAINLPGMGATHPLYPGPYTGGGAGGAGPSAAGLSGMLQAAAGGGGPGASAFHSPGAAEQALKLAQAQAQAQIQHLHIQDWMARSGMYLPRAVMDYNGQ